MIWKKKWGQKGSTGQRFIFTEVTSYKIHILEHLEASIAAIRLRKKWKNELMFNTEKWLILQSFGRSLIMFGKWNLVIDKGPFKYYVIK